MRVLRGSLTSRITSPILIYKEYFCIRLRFKTLNPLPLQLRNHRQRTVKRLDNKKWKILIFLKVKSLYWCGFWRKTVWDWFFHSQLFSAGFFVCYTNHIFDISDQVYLFVFLEFMQTVVDVGIFCVENKIGLQEAYHPVYGAVSKHSVAQQLRYAIVE